jgi:hypothetical protein
MSNITLDAFKNIMYPAFDNDDANGIRCLQSLILEGFRVAYTRKLISYVASRLVY